MRRRVVAAMLALLWALPAAAQFHTDPGCWHRPRLAHTGAPPQELAARVHLTQAPAGAAPTGEAVPAPNGAYRLWVRNPDTTQPGPWGAGLIVDVERERHHLLLLEDIAQPITPRWINEKLIFLRVAWGRTVFSDLILDVEAGRLVYHEQLHDGRIAWQQQRQACGGECRCPPAAAPHAPAPAPPPQADPAPAPAASAPGSGSAKTPLSQPTDDAPVGLLRLPGLLDAAPGQATPLPVYDRPEAGADKLAELRDGRVIEQHALAGDESAALVYATRPRWYRIGLRAAAGAGADRAWVFDRSAGEYLPLGAVLVLGPAALNAHWDGRLWEAPDVYRARRSKLKPHPGTAPAHEQHPVRVLGYRDTPRGLWLQIETLAASRPCADTAPRVLERGWIPAYDAAGRLVAEHQPRGC